MPINFKDRKEKGKEVTVFCDASGAVFALTKKGKVHQIFLEPDQLEELHAFISKKIKGE